MRQGIKRGTLNNCKGPAPTEMAKRLIREAAIKTAVDVFKKNKEYEEADQDKLVGAVQVTQRQTGVGTYVTPKPERSMEDEMKRKGPETAHGHKTFPAGYAVYDDITEFDVHPALMGCLGHLGASFVALYRNQKLRVSIDDKEASKAKAMANGIKRQAEFQNKSVKKMAESWLAQNHRQVDKTTAFHTIRELGIGTTERPVDHHNYNFSAGSIKTLFQ